MVKNLIMVIVAALIPMSSSAGSVEILSVNQQKALLKTGTVIHRLTVQQSDSDTVVVDTLFYYNPPKSNADYNDFLGSYQSAGDTCINRFTLLAPGKITKLMMQNSSTGTANWMIWTPAVKSGSYLFPGESGVTQLMPDTAAPHYCPQLNMSQQTPDSLLWNTYDLALERGASVIEIDSSHLDFWVGYRLDDTGNPKILQDNTYHYPWSEGDCRSFTTLQSQSLGKWYCDVQPGTDNWFAHMMQIEVVYQSIPPIISRLPDLCDTFSKSRTIWAEVVELEGDGFTVHLTTTVGKYGQPVTLDMLDDGDNYFYADLDYQYGDTLYYYVWAEDSTGMRQRSEEKSFVCVEPPENATILLIDDSTLGSGERYREALNRRGYDYFYWNVADHNGIDTTVIYYSGFLTLLVLDGKDMILPVTDIDDQDIYDIAGFLESGGNLMLVDMDYLYHWDLIGTDRFDVGDFAYDYLGIEDYTGDPDDDFTKAGGDADTLLISVAGNPVTSDFSTDSIAYGPLEYQIGDSAIENWADFIEPTYDAYGVLKGKNSDNGMAVCREAEKFRTATFLFPIEFAADTAEFNSLLDSTLHWLNENTTRLDSNINAIDNDIMVNTISTFRLEPNFPNPFNPSTNIRFQLLKNVNVSLTIFNVRGEQVDEILHKQMIPGDYSFKWTARTKTGDLLPSGVYFYRLKADSKIACGKMLLLR